MLKGVKCCYSWFWVKIGLLARNSESEILDNAVMVWKESFFPAEEVQALLQGYGKKEEKENMSKNIFMEAKQPGCAGAI